MSAVLGAMDCEALAAAHGTPFYLYDLDRLRENVRRVRAAFAPRPVRILFAAKANPNRAVLAGLVGSADGLDVASTGEVALALRAGWPAAALSFAGPGKTEAALADAVARGVGTISVESVRELDALAALARSAGRPARVMLRLNPAQRVHAFAVPMVGVPSPFGIDVEALPEAVGRLAAAGPDLAFAGIHVHPGAQCTSAEGIGAHARAVVELAVRADRAHGLRAPELNLGGGFGVLGDGQRRPLALERVAAHVEAALAAAGPQLGAVRLTFELGRYLAADAGVYVARVVSEKVSRGRRFVVLDGGMNHNLAATGLLAPRAPRLPVVNLSAARAGVAGAAGAVRPMVRCALVGPLCTPLDALDPDAELAAPRPGDLVGFFGAGAYGLSLSPVLFLGHDLPAELVREGGEVRVARPRRPVSDFG